MAYIFNLRKILAGWYSPGISAPNESKIGKSQVQGQPGQQSDTLSQTLDNKKKLRLTRDLEHITRIHLCSIQNSTWLLLGKSEQQQVPSLYSPGVLKNLEALKTQTDFPSGL